MTSAVGPPELPGYEYESDLGRGGFADVYRYRQFRPERQVAVKVMREASQSAADAERFENEINRMSMLSSHPSILTIYEVGMAPDGRPFFTMEYCPNDHFGQIAKSNPLPVARALEVGIKVAGAVDTAHAAGILHRDIKPANVLLTAYGEPALTDFGIAGGRDAEVVAEAEGVTIPFAPPEVVAGRSHGDELSDVYSLGATVYSLLAGRAPFSTKRRTTQAELISRITAGSPPPIGRQDVPAELEHVLATAMAVEPTTRYSSAAALGRALQTVEARLSLPQTSLRVAPSRPEPTRPILDPDDEDSTRFRAPTRVDPSQSPTTGRRPTLPHIPAAPISDVPAVVPSEAPAPRAPLPTPESASGHGLPVPDAIDAPTEHRARVAAPEPVVYDEPDENAGRHRGALLASVAAAVALVAVVVFVIVSSFDDEGDTPPTTTRPDEGGLVIVSPPLAPEDVTVTVEDPDRPAVVTWSTEQKPEPDDRYRIEVTEGPLAGQSFDTSSKEQQYRFPDRLSELCVRVYVVRGSSISDPSPEACQP